MEENYSGKRRAKELRDARNEAEFEKEEIFSDSDDENGLKNNKTNSESFDSEKTNACFLYGTHFMEKSSFL